jgi:hypothetical protein
MSALCPVCGGNDGDAPCLYSSEKRVGCLRDARLAKNRMRPTQFVFAPEEVDLSEIVLPMWTVYDRPRDFPDKLIVRLFEGKTASATTVAMSFDTMAQVMDTFRRWTFLTRAPNDDPNIVGTFI